MKIKMLLIGPFLAPPGGASVLFHVLVEELLEKKTEVSLEIVNTTTTKLFQIPSLYWEIFRKSRKSDIISFHLSPIGLAGIVISPFLRFIQIMYKKKWMTRFFAGDFFEVMENSNFIRGFIYKKIILKSDLLLAETKDLMGKLSTIHPNVKWFANHRKQTILPPEREPDESIPLKIVYMSHIYLEKGIYELIEASNNLNGVIIDVYGPFLENLNKTIFENSKINYKGIVEPQHVTKILSKYDALILPSYSEGYPGIVIEAMSVGLAIICSNLESLNEMLVAGEEAIMIPPKNSAKIVEAINFFNEDRNALNKFQKRSAFKFKEYDSKYWVEQFLKYSEELL